MISENVCHLHVFNQVFLFSHHVVVHKIILEKYAMFLDHMSYNFWFIHFICFSAG
jgi:hypothetical protein